MSIGEALGNTVAGYRDHDNKRCASGLVDAVQIVKRLEEALWRANRDKESILRRIETEMRSAEALPDTGEINNLLRAGRVGALYSLKEACTAAGWFAPRSIDGDLPASPSAMGK
jgi:hypothetical protein